MPVSVSLKRVSGRNLLENPLVSHDDERPVANQGCFIPGAHTGAHHFRVTIAGKAAPFLHKAQVSNNGGGQAPCDACDAGEGVGACEFSRPNRERILVSGPNDEKLVHHRVCLRNATNWTVTFDIRRIYLGSDPQTGPESKQTLRVEFVHKP